MNGSGKGCQTKGLHHFHIYIYIIYSYNISFGVNMIGDSGAYIKYYSSGVLWRRGHEASWSRGLLHQLSNSNALLPGSSCRSRSSADSDGDACRRDRGAGSGCGRWC
ncbi:hypothetical protein J5N97_026758 [Dioscorea zingiberensis]|uniref:Uncharacterized protein n=1 Tax=Dioscorea zingiberensis TaxID=325984 RepID=A0A9D5C3F1_9LILI|nr:hypothetical protein J5N97_026758 [Dioscorea zingiberensis]